MPDTVNRSLRCRSARRRFRSRSRSLSGLLQFETDCWTSTPPLAGAIDFVLLDVRSPTHFRKATSPGPSTAARAFDGTESRGATPEDALCRLLRRASLQWRGSRAIRLASLGRPVKKMIGGITGWIDEGFTLLLGGFVSEVARWRCEDLEMCT